MNYKHFLVTVLLISTCLLSKAQKITTAHFRISDKTKGFRSIELILDSKLVIGLDNDGNISYVDNSDDRGIDLPFDLYYNEDGNPTTVGNLTITYYDNSNKEKARKIKSIGTVKIDYYDHFDIHDPKGRIKSLGNIKVTYNTDLDIHERPGTIKSIGDIAIEYYNTSDIHDPVGKVKSIGTVKVTYFNKLDNEHLSGQIKSIKGNSRRLYVSK